MPKRLVLNAKLDTFNADTLRSNLIDAHGHDLVLDASQVELCGALCAELLLCARHLWHRQKTCLLIENATTGLIDTLGCMGLTLDDIQTGDAA